MNSLPGNVLIVAGSEADVPNVLEFLATAGIKTMSNSDLYTRHFRQFGIDDAQELRARASTRAIGDRRVFVISTGGMTNEAQNTLLKTLEEPPDNALFVFIVPAPQTLLATVRSRAQIITLEHKGHEAMFDVKGFLAAPTARRLDMLKNILKKDDDDKYDTGAILGFLAALERYAQKIKDPVKMHETLEAIYRSRTYMTDRGALVKTLLESVALLAPMV